MLILNDPLRVYTRSAEPDRVPREYQTIINQSHTLIAGATGAGKSTLIHGLIHGLLQSDPAQVALSLIDPKKVELYRYRSTPHCDLYADETPDVVSLLQLMCDTMDARYDTMRSAGSALFCGRQIYVIIDELADIMVQDKKHITPLLTRLTQLGRAAGIHVIAATQRPTRDIINGAISVNFDCKIALRCNTAQDSRNIIGVSGAELLPRFGQAIITSPDIIGAQVIDIERMPDDKLSSVLDLWQPIKPPAAKRERHRLRDWIIAACFLLAVVVAIIL